MGICSSFVTFSPSRFVVGQVVNVVLVQLAYLRADITDFSADTGNLLIQFRSDFRDSLVDFSESLIHPILLPLYLFCQLLDFLAMFCCCCFQVGK